MLCLISWRVEYSKYCSEGDKNMLQVTMFKINLILSQMHRPGSLLVHDMDTQSAVSHPHCSLLHPDMSLCRHFSPTVKEEGRGKQWKETKWKTNIQCKLFKQPWSLEGFQWCQIVTAQYPLEIRSGNPQWLDRALRFGKKRAGGEGVWSYWAKAEWVEIRHEDLWIHVPQIPREALALQSRTEIHTFWYVSKGHLLNQWQTEKMSRSFEISATHCRHAGYLKGLNL